jgi:chaperonin cofactor prefoldin
MQKLKSNTIALLGIMAIVLVFGVTLTSGTALNKKKSDQSLSALETKIETLTAQVNRLEKSDHQKAKKIVQLSSQIKQLTNFSNANAMLNTSAPVTTLAKISPKKTQAVPKKSQNKQIKKYYTKLEIAGFATYDVEFLPGQTALTQLISASQKYQFAIKTTTYDFGVFVNCLGNICGDANHFWALYKNGEMSMVGASGLVLNINDKISWVYTSF